MRPNFVVYAFPVVIWFMCFALVGVWLAFGLRNVVDVTVFTPSLNLAFFKAEAPKAGATPNASHPTLAPVFTPEVQHWAGKIAEWSQTYGLDPNLVATVMQIESCGRPSAVSSSGAQGLFQVMPFHFTDVEKVKMQDPDVNAKRGMEYLALGLNRSSGNAGLALAGYNGGHSMIKRDSAFWPGETKRYWYWGTGIYADALNGQAESPRLKEWLQAGGNSLCQKAARELGLSQ